MTHEELNALTLEKHPGSLVKITGEIPATYVEKHRIAAIKHLGKEVEIDGFRKGHVPEPILMARLGDMTILSEMAERCLRETYPKMVEHFKLEVIGYPEIGITKIAKDNPLGFTISVAVMPEISLPDYESLAKNINGGRESSDVTEPEVDAQIKDLLRQKVAYERIQEKAKQKKESDGVPHVHDKNCDHEGHDHGDHNHAHEHGDIEVPRDEEGELILPELTDEYVKTLGKPGQFESVADFRAKLKEHLMVEKARDVASRHRAKITDAIIEKSKLELPNIMVDAEINQMFAQMEDDLNRAQITLEDYLGHLKKTKDDLKKEWVPAAEKRAKLQLILNAIAQKENITPDPSLVDHEVSHLLEHYKDADEKRVRVYVTSVLTNDAVMKKLESIT